MLFLSCRYYCFVMFLFIFFHLFSKALWVERLSLDRAPTWPRDYTFTAQMLIKLSSLFFGPGRPSDDTRVDTLMTCVFIQNKYFINKVPSNEQIYNCLMAILCVHTSHSTTPSTRFMYRKITHERFSAAAPSCFTMFLFLTMGVRRFDNFW